MSGIYTVPFTYTGSDGSIDLCALVAHSTKQCVLLGFEIGQSSDVGDAAEEIIQIKIRSGQTTVGSGGSAVTPTPTDPVGSSASGFTARQADTTQAVTGTIVEHYLYNWNIRQSLSVILPEQWQLIFGAGRRLTIEGYSLPTDSLTITGYAVVQEIG